MPQARPSGRKPVLFGVRHSLGVLLSFVCAAGMVFAQTSTDEFVARQRGLTLKQVRGLHARFGLSNEAIGQITTADLHPMLWQIDHPDIDLHARAVDFRRLTLQSEDGQIPTNAWVQAAEQRRKMAFDPRAWRGLSIQSPPSPGTVRASGALEPLTAGIQSSGWTWLGPGNVGGRIRAMVVHPTIPGTMWVGGVGGGVWKTTNSGSAWFPLDDFLANLAISCMAIDPTDPDILYAGTGEGFYNIDNLRGAGVFKTTDGGTSWAQLTATATSSFYYVNRVAVHPGDGQVLLAATRDGIFRSDDGGTNWSRRSTTEMLDLAFDPSDGDNCVASGWNGVALYSTDSGLSWNSATGLPASSGFVTGRVEIAYAPSSPTTVYASIYHNSGEVYRSTDGGQSYSLRNTGNSFLGSQGWYDNCLWVDPTDPSVVLVGGLDLWRSSNGGTTFTDIGGYGGGIHPDQHVIVSDSSFDGTTVRSIFVGNDGGIFRATDVYSVSSSSGWTELNNNLGITQFYGAAGNATSGSIVGGTQDNGTIRYTTAGGTEAWTRMFGGDGGFCAADPTDASYFYGEYVYLQIHRSSNGGASSSYIDSGISDAGDPNAANFIAPFILDPNDPNTMLAGGVSLWRSSNVKAVHPNWSSIKSSTGTPISAMAVALGDSDVIWVGDNDGKVYYTTTGTAGSPTWNRVDLGTPNLPDRYCTRITIDPSSPSRVYVTFGGFNSGNVWRTTDSGSTWTDISRSLPTAPVRSLVINSSDTNALYLGTETGVFASADGGATWSPSNDGPANVSVDELFWMDDVLVAATHGRGLFSIGVMDAQVVGRYVFYNNSAWDGNDPSATVEDDTAIATNKTALLPGGTASFANYASYSLGLNGIMLDIAALGGSVTTNDFVFKTGNDNMPSTWNNAPAPESLTTRSGAGASGSDRITIIWADNAIQQQWLQITALANSNTGLVTNDVFYFGNALAESGDNAANAQVNLADEIGARNNPRTFLDPAAIDDPYDYDRNQRVNLADEILARNNGTTFLTALQLIDLTSPIIGLASAARSGGETRLSLTIQERDDGLRILCHGEAQITPTLTATRDFSKGAWTPVGAAPTYDAADGLWIWHIDSPAQPSQMFFRLENSSSN